MKTIRPVLAGVFCFMSAVLLPWNPATEGLAEEVPPAPADSGLIRVALPITESFLRIESNPHLLIQAHNGKRSLSRSFTAVHVGLGKNGLTLNGDETPFRKMTVRNPDGLLRVNRVPVRGHLSLLHNGKELTVVNILPLEDYLKGVVPVEISAEWHPEVLKVQAIISRTYALYQRQTHRERAYDLVSTTLDQVYGGTEKEHSAANQAILETRGTILTHDGEVIQSFFHSTSAGPTEDAGEVWQIDLPYLKGVSCPFDEASPYYDWSVSIPMAKVRRSLEESGITVGAIAAISPLRWTRAGRVDRVRIIHSGGELVLKAPEFRKILGYTTLPSTRFIIEKIGKNLRLRGLGAGHAVGLCQWGAKEMAEQGYTHDAILSHYYPGAELSLFSSLPKPVQSP